jgi:hypothetical protein
VIATGGAHLRARCRHLRRADGRGVRRVGEAGRRRRPAWVHEQLGAGPGDAGDGDARRSRSVYHSDKVLKRGTPPARARSTLHGVGFLQAALFEQRITLESEALNLLARREIKCLQRAWLPGPFRRRRRRRHRGQGQGRDASWLSRGQLATGGRRVARLFSTSSLCYTRGEWCASSSRCLWYLAGQDTEATDGRHHGGRRVRMMLATPIVFVTVTWYQGGGRQHRGAVRCPRAAAHSLVAPWASCNHTVALTDFSSSSLPAKFT